MMRKSEVAEWAGGGGGSRCTSVDCDQRIKRKAVAGRDEARGVLRLGRVIEVLVLVRVEL